MDIVIDIDSPEPLFAQLVTQVKRAVQRGKVRPGDPLPSIRQLAVDLELNSKTVAKAYRLLERDSVIQTRGYRGTFVHADAKANSRIDLAAWAHDTMTNAINACRSAGVTDSELRIAFANAMNERSHGASRT